MSLLSWYRDPGQFRGKPASVLSVGGLCRNTQPGPSLGAYSNGYAGINGASRCSGANSNGYASSNGYACPLRARAYVAAGSPVIRPLCFSDPYLILVEFASWTFMWYRHASKTCTARAF